MIPDIRDEFLGAQLGDSRRTARLLAIAEDMQAQPNRSFPKALRDEASIEGFYRLMNSPDVSLDGILAPHHARSWERADGERASTLVLHDTSYCTFPGEITRRGLPRDGKKQGFYLHAALAVAEGPFPVVHGLVGIDVYTVWDKGWYRETTVQQEELCVGSLRWSDLVQEVHASAPAELPLIHVMDREADDYVLWSGIVVAGGDFVIRSKTDRPLSGEAKRVSVAVALANVLAEREVPLSKRSDASRPPKSRQAHPERLSRTAKLSLKATIVSIQRPDGAAPVGNETMTLWAVDVIEPEPPKGEAPVHWRLLTTLPADTAEAAWRIVDIYRKRWLIEEYFKSLKTGCALKSRQADSLPALMNVLALLLPMAWRLLVIRAIEREDHAAPAETVLPKLELQVLRNQVPAKMLPKSATARHVLLAIAYLGGHLKRNGAPGWIVLGRGLEDLLKLAEGWRAALRHIGHPSAGS